MHRNKLAIAARENLASDMCHSTETQDTYRWISGDTKHTLCPSNVQKNFQIMQHTLGVFVAQEVIYLMTCGFETYLKNCVCCQ